MSNQNLHEQLQQISRHLQEAQSSILEARGTDPELMAQAHEQLQRVEQELQDTQHQSGKEATENSQFQQAYEQLHDTRQQMQQLKQNND
ncbi:hypothetical protein [Sediminibacillus massiliensis]|uniref:hypothetical protein n=1 Tax=Sediminibacillus massiliensis TaxID=1926277 RepID=UPI0009888981|nr:hypothetical protein [Sediminibacillus massiliensis]